VDYLSSTAGSGKKADLSKSVAAEKISISRQSLYYQPLTPAKDLALKQQIEAVEKSAFKNGYCSAKSSLGLRLHLSVLSQQVHVSGNDS